MSYNFRTVVGDWSWTEVGQRSDRGQTKFGWKSERIPVTQLDLDQTYYHTLALVLDAKPPFASKTILL